MTMTIREIEDHAGRLHDRLQEEKHKVRRGEYDGPPQANLNLIRALEGRIDELLRQCQAAEPARVA
jgi:hypothetical protein